MSYIKKYLKKFVKEEDGAELVEWAIVIAIVAVIAVPVLTLVGTAKDKVNDAQKSIAAIDPDEGSSTSSSSSSGTSTTGSGSSGSVSEEG